MILILQPTSKRKKPGLVVLRTNSLIDEMTASQGLEMNTATQPIDVLAPANKIERLIPGDPLAAELRRLHIVEQEFQQWINKTEWVQKSAQSHELGMHRADVMKQRLDQLLSAELEAIGAGGVGPLMKPVISSHVDQHLDKVWLPRTLLNRSIQEIVRYCNTGEMDDAESLLASLQFSIDPAQQPPKDEPAPLEFRA